MSFRASSWRTRIERWLRSRWTTPALFAGEFLETTILPWPIEAALAALMLGDRRRIPLYLATVIAATLAGSALMYGVGLAAADALAGRLPFLGEAQLNAYRARFVDDGFWAVVSGGILPVPWQIVTLSAGAASYDFAAFMLAVLIGRGVRFGLVAAAVLAFGPAAARWWREIPARWKIVAWSLGAAALAAWTLVLLL